MKYLNGLTLLFFLISPGILRAQLYSVIGSVANNKNETIESGNAIALFAEDSSIIKGTFFINGKFRLDGLSESFFILKVTSLGYSENIQRVAKPHADSVLDVGTVYLNTATLKEVEVTARIPLFEMDGEKIKVNVENTGLSASGTALDVLRKSPTVMVGNNDNVSLFGKGAAVVYVDGQQVVSGEILKTIPSAEIKEIEIIANPSAKYDAAGRAVINIITKKNNLEGYNGSIIQNTLYGKYLYSYSGFQLNYKRLKWSASISYGLAQGRDWSTDDYYRKFSGNDGSVTTEMKNEISTVKRLSNIHYYSMGGGYSFDSLNTIRFQYNGFYNEKSVTTENENAVFKNSAPWLRLQTTTLGRPIIVNHSASIIYSGKLDTLGSELRGVVQGGGFLSDNLEYISQYLFSGNDMAVAEKRNTGMNNICILTAQADLNKSLSKKWVLETGIKNAYIANKSEIRLDNLYSGKWLADPVFLNSFSYNENISAAYFQLRYKKNKFNARAGVRGEHTVSNGFSHVANQEVISRKYFNLFPNTFASYDFTPDFTTSLSYTSRITRPSYQDMDPFINYIDSLSSFRGNPYLLPEYTGSFEASLIYMKEASFTFGYTRADNAINLVVEKAADGSDAFIATTRNLEKSESYSAGLTIPYELSWWTTYNYVGYFKNIFSYRDNGILIENKKPLLYFYAYNEFRIEKLFSLEVTFDYTSSGVDGIFIFDPFYTLSANLKRTFFKDKLTCRLMANDILSSYVMSGKSKLEGFNVNYVSRENTHYFVLALNYKFGKLKAADKADDPLNREEYERIKMNR